MSSTLRRGHRAWLLKAAFVLVACFAAGLVTAGIVSGAGPLGALSSVTDPGTTDTETTETTTEPTESEPTEPAPTEPPTDPTETGGETEVTETTETQATEPSPHGPPSIRTNNDDYAPGALVLVVGSGWHPEEPVEVFVNDDEGQSWSHRDTAVADAAGDFYYEFRLPEWFVATYSLTATGASSGVVNWSFTDSIATGDHATASNGDPGASEITIATPATSSGALLVAQIAVQGLNTSAVICTPDGWTTKTTAPSFRTNNSSSVAQQVFYRIADGTETASYTWRLRTSSVNCGGTMGAVSGLGAVGGIISYSGVDVAHASGPVFTNAGATGSSTTQNAPSVGSTTTPIPAGSKVLRFFSNDKEFVVSTAASSSNGIAHSHVYSVNRPKSGGGFEKPSGAAADADQPSTETTTGTLTGSNSGNAGNWVAQTFVLRMAALPASAAPSVNSPICAGATSVSGTSSEANGTTIEVFKGTTSLGTTTVSGGTWTKTGLAALAAGDQIKARATAAGKSVSGDSNVVNVTTCNTPPVANDDAYSVNEDNTLAVAAPGVLANDTDSDGNMLTAVLVSGPSNAQSFVLNANGSFSYTPNANVNGPDSFTYRANDGTANSGIATVTITVNAVDDAPTAVDDAATVAEDSGATAVDVLANDTDPDGGPKTIASASDPAHGTVVVAGDNLSLTYAPDANYCNDGTTTDNFTYTLNGGSTATARMTVTCVDDPPTAVDDAATVAEDSGATAVDVLANDTDPDGGTKTITAASDPAHGTVVITGGGSGLTYAPDGNYCNDGTTTDDFTYTLNGGSQATVRMTVTCVDDPPTAVDDAKTVLEDSGATTVDVLANDTDSDGGPKTIAAASDPAHGTVVVAGDNLSLTYAPDANYCNDGTTTDNFTYTLNGGSTATVRMTVTCVDDPPVVAFTGGATSRTEGQSDTYTFSITDPDSSSFSYESGYPTCGTGGTLTGTPTLGSSGGSFQCSFPDGPKSPTLAVQVRDATSASNEATRSVTVTNVDPTVAKPFFQPTQIGCQSSTTLKGISFGDPGVNDGPWAVDIDWGDGSDHFTYTTSTQGAQPDRSHMYATPGTFTATVKVTDKDGGEGTNSTTANSLTVFQYSVDFLPPFDDSTPSGLIVNKMKNGRVVPVKARITDLCSGSDLTGPGPLVTIKVTKTSGSGTSDPIETYADAGESSAGTNEFRYADGFWIYNLDSKALGLVVDNMYRVDVYVNHAKATISNWAVLQPVK